MRQKRRRATTKMQLLNLLIGTYMLTDQIDFAKQALQVGLGPAAILGDDLVAGAVVADVGAERDVHIERQLALLPPAEFKGSNEIGRGDAIMELDCGGIGGVTRTGVVITSNQLRVPAYGVEHG